MPVTARDRRERARPVYPLPADLTLLNDAALLAHLQFVLAFVRARRLDGDLLMILGEELLDMQIEAEGRRSAAGEPSMFAELPSVREALLDRATEIA